MVCQWKVYYYDTPMEAYLYMEFMYNYHIVSVESLRKYHSLPMDWHAYTIHANAICIYNHGMPMAYVLNSVVMFAAASSLRYRGRGGMS